MTTERTEDAGLSGVLELIVHGDKRKLRCLTIDEADAWLEHVGMTIAAMEITDSPGADVMAHLLKAGSAAAADALAAYDVDGVLGGPSAIRHDFTPQELKTAMEVVSLAAAPFDEDAARSVASAFGAPSRTLALGLAMTFLRASPQEPSTPGRSDAGASGTTGSARRGRRSSSSSGGSTDTSSSRPNGSSAATQLPTA